MDLTAWLLMIAWPVVKKVLVALGVGMLTFEGLSLVGSQVQSLVLSYWGQMPASVLSVLSMSGMSESVGITLAALSARISLVAIGKIGKIAS